MSSKAIHVVAAAIVNNGSVLIAKRNAKQHQGNKWEFPGGKVENEEDSFQALKRELKEELDIDGVEGRPLIQLSYQYPDKLIYLDVWKIDRFEGNPKGMEGQPLRWVDMADLKDYTFPAANAPIIDALRLPEAIQITAASTNPRAVISSSKNDFMLVRQPRLDAKDYTRYAASIDIKASRLLLTSTKEEVEEMGAAGLHLNSLRLMQASKRLLTEDKWLSAAVHNIEQLEQAHRLNVDFIFVSPVKETSSHPGTALLGWDGFYEIVKQSTLPVYALGGLGRADLIDAWRHGAQGVAGISHF